MNNTTVNIIEDIAPISVFRQQTAEIIRDIKSKKRPTFITVKGRVEAVIQDAHDYQEMVDRIEELETLLSIQRGMEDIKQGRVQEMDSVFDQLRATE